MRKQQRRLVRIIAILLAVLLAGSALISAIFSLAYAEEAMPASNTQTITMEYLENEQALRISQRLVYTNASDVHLDRVVFYAPANLLRRQAAMLYAAEDLAAAYPGGYAPGGVELASVSVGGARAEYGFQGDAEMYLRVACDLDSGESCEFAFDYYLLLSANRAFTGIDDTDLRLSNFYFAPAALDETRGEFILNSPLSFTEYIETPPADFTVSITLPESVLVAATGTERTEALENKLIRWTVSAENACDFALNFGNFKEITGESTSGIALRCLSEDKSAAKRILSIAQQALSACESWFGPLPIAQLDFVQSGDARPFTVHSGTVWLNAELLSKKNEDALAHAIRFAVAKQYFGKTARARVSSDAWLSDSISEYLAYLLLEECDGHDVYVKSLNDNLVASLQLTVPGGLVVTSDAALFTSYEYEIVILDRGAAVFHELRTSMGRDELLQGLGNFYRMGLQRDILTEMDLVSALDAVGAGKWEKFLTDWVFNIGEYVNQTIEWLD